MSGISRSGSAISMAELERQQSPVSRQSQQSRGQFSRANPTRPAIALAADVVQLKDPDHLGDTFREFDKLHSSRNERIYAGAAVALTGLGATVGFGPAGLSVSRSCNPGSSTASHEACVSAGLSLVGAAVSAVGVTASVLAYRKGATNFSEEVTDMDRKLSSRYRQEIRARTSRGERFEQGMPNFDNLVTRYMELDKTGREEVIATLNVKSTEQLAENAANDG